MTADPADPSAREQNTDLPQYLHFFSNCHLYSLIHRNCSSLSCSIFILCVLPSTSSLPFPACVLFRNQVIDRARNKCKEQMLYLHHSEGHRTAGHWAPQLPGLHSLRNVNHSGHSSELSRFLSGRRILRVIQPIAEHPTHLHRGLAAPPLGNIGVPARCCCAPFPSSLSKASGVQLRVLILRYEVRHCAGTCFLYCQTTPKYR